MEGQKVTDTISFKVEFENGNNGYSANLKLGSDGLIFTDERLIYRSDKSPFTIPGHIELAEAIGLDKIRAKSSRFNGWIKKLEEL